MKKTATTRKIEEYERQIKNLRDHNESLIAQLQGTKTNAASLMSLSHDLEFSKAEVRDLKAQINRLNQVIDRLLSSGK